jgi:hypothetical protein
LGRARDADLSGSAPDDMVSPEPPGTTGTVSICHFAMTVLHVRAAANQAGLDCL